MKKVDNFDEYKEVYQSIFNDALKETKRNMRDTFTRISVTKEYQNWKKTSTVLIDSTVIIIRYRLEDSKIMKGEKNHGCVESLTADAKVTITIKKADFQQSIFPCCIKISNSNEDLLISSNSYTLIWNQKLSLVVNGTKDQQVLKFTVWQNSKFIGDGIYYYDYNFESVVGKQIMIHDTISKKTIGTLSIEIIFILDIKFSVENQETEYIVKLEREFDNLNCIQILENNYLFVDDIKIEIENLNGKKEIIIENQFKFRDLFCQRKNHSSNEFHLIFKNLEEKSSVESIKEYENSSGVLFTGYDFIECLNHDLFVSTYEISFLFKFKLSDELKDLPLWTTNEKEVIISTFYCSIIQKNNVEISTKDETNKDDFLFQLNQVYKKNDWNTKIVTYSSSTLKEYYNGILFEN
eukprot:gene2024-1531_t